MLELASGSLVPRPTTTRSVSDRRIAEFGTAGEHDRVRDLPEEPRHVAEQSINGKPRKEQHHAIRIGHHAPALSRNCTRRGE